MGARKDVLAFYEELPFNYWANPVADADQLRRVDPLQNYPPLTALLATAPRLLDIGCGTGWLPNAAAYRYRCPAHGIDYNSIAIARAREVAQILGIDTQFQVADFFNYRPPERFSLVTCVGVLHHTDDCLGGLAHIAETMVDADGRMFIGLYHSNARRPFLEHFAEMKRKGAGLDELYAAFRALQSGGRAPAQDETFLRSWFRDQVLHPHETQHTLAEIIPVLDALGFELESTSTNRFAPLPKLSQLIADEAELENAARLALVEGRYLPGFFVFMARRQKR